MRIIYGEHVVFLCELALHQVDTWLPETRITVLIQELHVGGICHFMGVNIIAAKQDRVNRLGGREPVTPAAIAKRGTFIGQIGGRRAHLE